jgi:rhamnosyltransferase
LIDMNDETAETKNASRPAPAIGILVPTLNAGGQIERCLGPIVRSPYAGNYRILVIDSRSTDDTVERARRLGVECDVIERAAFDHGLTRNAARKKLNTPVVVCMTQDAYPTGPDTIERLVAPLVAGTAQASYGRQMPRPGCDLIEAYAREFSYGAESYRKSWADRARFQLRLYMCSNSFAAYDNAALDRVGGFPETLFGEDFLTAMALIKSGGTIAYQADAVVEHSHHYSFRAEVKRNFQIGTMHSMHPELFEGLPKKDGSGVLFARGLLSRAFAEEGIRGVARSFVYLGARWTSYQLGRHGPHAPERRSRLTPCI